MGSRPLCTIISTTTICNMNSRARCSLSTQLGDLLETLDLLVSAIHNDGAVDSITEPSLGIHAHAILSFGSQVERAALVKS